MGYWPDLTKFIEGNMPVDTHLATKLEGFTGISSGFWMNLQNTYDIYVENC